MLEKPEQDVYGSGDAEAGVRSPPTTRPQVPSPSPPPPPRSLHILTSRSLRRCPVTYGEPDTAHSSVSVTKAHLCYV